MSRVELPSKFSGETKTYYFNFAEDLAEGETIDAATVTATVYSGTDAAPSGILDGAAAISGANVTQSVQAGTEGVLYTLLARATTSEDQVLQRSGILAVIPETVG